MKLEQNRQKHREAIYAFLFGLLSCSCHLIRVIPGQSASVNISTAFRAQTAEGRNYVIKRVLTSMLSIPRLL